MILFQCSSCKNTAEINKWSTNSAVPVGWIEIRVIKREDRRSAMLESMFEMTPPEPTYPTAFCSKQCLIVWAMTSEPVEEK